MVEDKRYERGLPVRQQEANVIVKIRLGWKDVAGCDHRFNRWSSACACRA
jgi:hypothetical protein